MSTPTFENLDLSCATFGRELAEAAVANPHKSFTDALAVLDEQGLYALHLFLVDRSMTTLWGRIHTFLKVTPQVVPCLANAESLGSGDWYKELSADLDRLLLACELVRQSLVYARYHSRQEGKQE